MFWRILLVTSTALVLFIAFLLFRPYTQNKQSVRIHFYTDAAIDEVDKQLDEKNILGDAFWLRVYARVMGIRRVPAGSYLIPASQSLFRLGRGMLLGRQSPVKLILGNERIRLRTNEQFAAKMQRFEYTRADSAAWMQFLGSNDSLETLELDVHTARTRLLPLTYEVYWTESPGQIFQVFEKAWVKFWNETRSKQAKQLGLSPTEVYILASIVEEETQHTPDRPLIASTYLNRLRIGMRLQADPTAKFASGDFETNRVTFWHLRYPSPYNTYLVNGLPPGSICLPSIEAIDAVLQAPKTDYLYFVASARFDGTSVFTKDYKEHLRNAKMYQDELNRRQKKIPKPTP